MRSTRTELEGLMRAWFMGWSDLRSYQTSPEDAPLAALRLDRSGDWEYFLCEPTPTEFVMTAAHVVTSETRVLTVLGDDISNYVHMAHQTGLGMVSIAERFMSVPLDYQDKQEPFFSDPSVVLSVVPLGGKRVSSGSESRLIATIEVDGVLAASGKVAIHDEYAIFDQIETRPEYRHRGYGRAIMQALAANVSAFSVTTGLLLASIDGQRLYSKMGWYNECAVTVLAPKARLAKIAAQS